jgi:hypothetical protein
MLFRCKDNKNVAHNQHIFKKKLLTGYILPITANAINDCIFILLPKGEKCGVAMLSRDKIRQKRSNKIWGFPKRRKLSLCANALEKTKRRKDDFFKHPLFKGIPRKKI